MFVQILAGIGFFALILASVGLHELGHFLPAKAFNIKVRQFFIGFGPNLWKTKKGETEYGVKAIPLGGYCAILGMVPPYREGKNTWLKRFADMVREADWMYITPEDVAGGRLFYQARFLKRCLIMAGGVMMNLLLSFALFLGCNLAYGQYDPDQATLRVYGVVASVALADGDVTTPGAAAGLEAGDTIVSLNGAPLTEWEDYRAGVRATLSTGADGTTTAGPLTFTVDRPGEGVITLPTVDGLVVPYEDGSQGPYTGISFYAKRVPVGPVGTLKMMGEMSWISVKAIAQLPYLAWTTLRDMVMGEPRDPEGAMSVIGAARLAGEVAGTSLLDTESKIALWVTLLAGVNLFVGLLNLVPLLPFDGGHVAAGIYGLLRSWLARLRGRPDPGPVDAAKLQPVAYVVAGLLILIGAILIVADVISPVQLF
jgi:membrane-associated protease RseP (regulator of RpoE activity)